MSEELERIATDPVAFFTEVHNETPDDAAAWQARWCAENPVRCKAEHDHWPWTGV